MRHLLFTCFTIISFLGFAQEQVTKNQPLFISSISFTYLNFNSSYNGLDEISKSIMEKKLSLNGIDNIR
ncbi:MAG: hypothetical protein QNK89_08580 [Lacinutrix sp.]|uniref:hypothetical protein n=1 Tax=Lacinutrix sp. TaxID=1937692 RepID=UPI00309FB811